MRYKPFLLTIFVLLSGISSAYASWQNKPEFRWRQSYRLDDRRWEENLYTNRLSAEFFYLGADEKKEVSLTPFLEARYNSDGGDWERLEAGIEIGRQFLPWLYLGESFQAVWLKEDYMYYKIDEGRNSSEAETRLLVRHKLYSNEKFNSDWFFLDEYTYDFGMGQATRNEVAIGVIIPVNKYFETGLNWRHIDRISDYDSDTFEFQATVVF